MKSKRKKFIPFLERLTPEQFVEFRRVMAKIKRRINRRMRINTTKAEVGP